MASPYATGNEVVDKNATQQAYKQYQSTGYNTRPATTNFSTIDAAIGKANGVDPFAGWGQVEAAVDPYARWGGEAQYNALRGGIMDEKQGYINSAGSSIDQFGQRYGNSITDYLDSIRSGQQNIDTMGAKNELARNQGQAGILGMVGRGINSAGVMLGNRNAGDSSAAGAIANAYGKLGQQQMSNVGNQYELGNMDIQNQQTQFDVQKGKGKRDLELGKSEFVTNLLNDTQDKLSQLNARLVDASLPDRIAIEQEKEAIRQRATSSLQQFDQNLTSGYGGVQASSLAARRAEAQRLQNMGTNLGADAFNFTDQAPMEFQGSAPAGSNLPIFTLPRRRER